MEFKSAIVAPALVCSNPLSALPAGSRGTLIELTADPEAMRRMASLGFIPGTEIAVVQNPRYGPLIILLRNIRIALGRAEARQVQVRRHE
jgi:ferrous iron transport protein A